MKRFMLIVGLVSVVVFPWALAQAGGESTGDGTASSGESADAEVTRVEPMPASVDTWPEKVTEVQRRIPEWANEVGAEQMTHAQLVEGMDALTKAMSSVVISEELGWPAVYLELDLRRILFCGELPTGHPYRGGEFCA